MIFGLLFHSPLLFIAWLLAIALAISIHEFFHALAAFWQGDETAKYAGRLTLNPLAHLDLMGSLLLIFVGIGWGKPVPFNPENLRNKKWGQAIVAFAGPFSNFLLAFLSALFLKSILQTFQLERNNLGVSFFALLIFLNLILMLFNLIPIPPLDGSKILYALLPAKYENFKYNLERNGPFILLFLIFLDRFLPYPILSSLLLNLVMRIATLLMPNFPSLLMI